MKKFASLALMLGCCTAVAQDWLSYEVDEIVIYRAPESMHDRDPHYLLGMEIESVVARRMKGGDANESVAADIFVTVYNRGPRTHLIHAGKFDGVLHDGYQVSPTDLVIVGDEEGGDIMRLKPKERVTVKLIWSSTTDKPPRDVYFKNRL